MRGAAGSGTQRLYGFRDILVLKLVKRLLDTGISLQQIRAAVDQLRESGINDLAQTTLMSDGASVYLCTSTDEVIDLVSRGQGVFGIAVGKVLREVEHDLAQLPSERAEHEVDVAPQPGDELGARRAARLALTCLLTGRRGLPVGDRRPPLTPCGRDLDAPRRGAEGANLPANLSGAKDHTGQAPLEHPAPRRGVTVGGDVVAVCPPGATVSTPTTDLPAFAARHIGPREDDVATMLEVVGRSSLADLVDTAVPGGIRGAEALHIEPAASEAAVLDELREVAARNHRVRPR